MLVQLERWGQLPLLHVYNDEITNDSPTVILLHGHMSAKEHNLHYAYLLVQKGIRVLLPDAFMHGERYNGESELELTLKFWDIVLNSVQDVHTIYEMGLQKQLFKERNVGVMGISMGAITTSACLTKYDWIKAAGICMGVTSITKLAKHQLAQLVQKNPLFPLPEEFQQQLLHNLLPLDLENKKEVFSNVPIIFWHGAQDPIVPISCSYPYYEQNLQHTKAQYIKDDKAEHAVTRAGLLKVTTFIAQHLSE